MGKPARASDASDGHATPDDLIVVIAVLLADHGGAHHQVLVGVVGHAVGIASGERGGEVEVIRTQPVLIPAPVYGGCVMASVAGNEAEQ